MPAILVVCFLCGLLPLLLGGCGGATLYAEREVVQAARRYIGPADRYDADVEGLETARADRVRLIGYGVRPVENFVLQQLTLEFDDVTYQRDPFRITGIGSARFSAQITETAVTQYLAARANESGLPVSNPRVTFARDLVRVSGSATLAGQPVTISLAGTLLAQGSQVLFQPREVAVEPFILAEAGQALARTSYQLVDFSDVTAEPRIQTISLQPGVLTVTGTANAARLVESGR